MARIVTVYHARAEPFRPVDMSLIRWLEISRALARRGHQVDMATNEPAGGGGAAAPLRVAENLRRVPLADVDWSDYDAVKTLFHIGFQTLESYGGTRHPFIISKLGSVVARQEVAGIYFYGRHREELYATQQRIARTSRYVTLLTEPARDLWQACFGPRTNLLLVPGAAEREIPPSLRDPFPADGRPRCIFAGNVYGASAQPEANRVLVDKLNRLGRLLSAAGIRLFLLGPGDVERLDPRHVSYLGAIPYERSWDYLHFAQVGIVVAAGSGMHNNESTKIYHYLRAGLPVVSEAGFPNDDVVRASRLGFVVENGNLELMAQRVIDAVAAAWDRPSAVRYVMDHHTWDRRVEVYDRILQDAFGAVHARGSSS